MQKDEIADILKEIGVFLELKGENPFKTRAYQNGARTLEGLTEPLEVLIEEERLGKVKGIGTRCGANPGLAHHCNKCLDPGHGAHENKCNKKRRRSSLHPWPQRQYLHPTGKAK